MYINITRVVVCIFLFMLTSVCMPYPVSIVNNVNTSFQVIPLGTSGGELENNLSAYLIKPKGTNEWIALDAGTLCSETTKIGIDYTSIKAYLISHAHLDHISGMIICSTTDKNKSILGLESTINYLRDYIFNWKIWPNFADEGSSPLLKTYHYNRLIPDKSVNIPLTQMTVIPFLLNHGQGYPSTAFLVGYHQKYLLYFGDTGADSVEKSHDIQHVWQTIAPLIERQALSAIFIEASYTNDRADTLLFGHLTPRLLLQELHQLALLVNPQNPRLALNGMNVIVTHIKQGKDTRLATNKIVQQLNQDNDLGILFILPHQGQTIEL